MLTWWTEANGTFLVGKTEADMHAVIFRINDKRLVDVSNKLTPDEFRQVADKLEELQGKEETGKALQLELRGGKHHGEEVRYVHGLGERLGYFMLNNESNKEEFVKTIKRELSPMECSEIADFYRRLNFRL